MADGDGARTVREDRELGGFAGTGEVTPASGDAEADRRIAAARAWLAVARAAMAVGARPQGFEAARRGVEELGDGYAVGSDVEDDTSLKLLAAEQANDEGAEHAPTAMMRVLEDRIGVAEAARR